MAKRPTKKSKKTPLIIPATIMKAYARAKEARLRAHAPYSGFRVGASLVTAADGAFEGCNVENASYGGAVCAERVAILKSVSEGALQFKDIVVVTDAPTPAFPCAFCLQVMAEFFDPNTRIWVSNLEGISSMHRFIELLPQPFGPKQLREAPRNKSK